MKANDNPIKKENSITEVSTDNAEISDKQKGLIDNIKSTYFTEKNGDEANKNYINIDKIHPDLKNIIDTLKNIKTILEYPTKGNIQKLQQFIYNNLEENEKDTYLKANKDKKITPNPDQNNKITWD
jgi:hypothetical protein